MPRPTLKSIAVLAVGALLALAAGAPPEPPAAAQDAPDAQAELMDLLRSDGLTREQLAGLYRSLALGEFEPPACVAGEEMFTDVPATHPFCSWIEELARRGIASGCTATTYCPGNPVTRAQMAVFVVKAIEGAVEASQQLAGFGQIRSDGSIRLASPSLVSVDHIATGVYCLTFDPPPSQTGRESVVASVHAADAIGFAGTGDGVGDNAGCPAGTMSIVTKDASGANADRRFSFQVPR